MIVYVLQDTRNPRRFIQRLHVSSREPICTDKLQEAALITEYADALETVQMNPGYMVRSVSLEIIPETVAPEYMPAVNAATAMLSAMRVPVDFTALLSVINQHPKHTAAQHVAGYLDLTIR